MTRYMQAFVAFHLGVVLLGLAVAKLAPMLLPFPWGSVGGALGWILAAVALLAMPLNAACDVMRR